jgi:predicted ATP-binding protein involved in virulence
MYIRSLEIEHFRCFEQTSTDFVYPSTADNLAVPNVNLLLGVNGAGKTTLLKAIALAILAPLMPSSGYKPYYLVRRQAKDKRTKATKHTTAVSAELLLHEEDRASGSPREETVSTSGAHVTARGSYETIVPMQTDQPTDPLFDDTSQACFMVGYGATRRVESTENLDAQGTKRRGLRYQRVAGIFEEYITLFPLGAWLPRLQSTARQRFNEITRLFRDLLPEDTQLTGEFEEFEPLFHHRGIDLPFGALSDGYRGYIGLIGDLLYHLHLNCPKSTRLTDRTGVVLVDDIDLHLHPGWQRTVVPCLAKTFPRLQFVLTSHSPIVVGTLHARNLRIVEESEIKRLEERVHGLSADQILTSSYFNLATTRSPDAEAKLKKLSEEVGERNDPDAAIKFLQELAGTQDGSRHE